MAWIAPFSALIRGQTKNGKLPTDGKAGPRIKNSKVVHPTEAYAGQFLGGFWEASLRCPMLRKAMALAEKFDTPLAHQRPRDLLAGCFPAEPASVLSRLKDFIRTQPEKISYWTSERSLQKSIFHFKQCFVLRLWTT